MFMYVYENKELLLTLTALLLILNDKMMSPLLQSIVNVVVYVIGFLFSLLDVLGLFQ